MKPLYLKKILTDAGLTQKAVASAVQLSPATIAQIVNYGLWPKSLDCAPIKAKIRNFLQQHGVSEAGIDAAFRPCSRGTARRAPTESNHVFNQVNHNKEDTMLHRKQGLIPAARAHFNLFRDPFHDEINSHEDLFISPEGRYVREAMLQTAKHGGFMAVVGESGAGKSTLRRDLIDRIERESASIIVIEPYVLGMEDNDAKGKTLRALHIAEAILNTVAPLEKPKRSPEARFRQLHKVLRDSRRAGNSHVLVIEEAHSLSIPTIKHLKRFFELEDGFKKLLSIILIGQPELKLKLSENNHEVREVVQRCELVELMPLDTQLTEFLKFKFERVGKKMAEVIDAGGIETLRGRLTLTEQGRRGGYGAHGGLGAKRETLSLLYPLAVGNLLTAAMNLAADIGVPVVNADVIKGV